MIPKLIFAFLLTCFCVLIYAEDSPVLSPEDTDKLINESIVQQKSIEKRPSYGYKDTKSKKVRVKHAKKKSSL